MSDDVSAEVVRRRPTLEDRLRRGLERGAAAGDGIPRRPAGEPAPLSFAQRRLWFLEQLVPGTAAFHIGRGVELAGPLSPPALARAFAAAVRRHPALTAAFDEVEGEPVQRLGAAPPPPLGRLLAGAPPLLELPTDRPRPPVGRQRGDRVVFELDAATAAAVDALARRLAATPFVLLLAAFQAFLGRLAGAREVVVGTPVANRRQVETEGLIGFFASTLAVRTDLGGDPTFAELVARVRNGWLDDFEQPGPALRGGGGGAGAAARHVARAGLPGALRLQNAPRRRRRRRRPDDRAQRRAQRGGEVRPPADLSPMAAGGFIASLEYDRDLFDRATAERWSRCLATLLAGAVAEPERGARRPAAARRRRGTRWWRASSRRRSSTPARRCSTRWWRQAAATPEAPAVRFEGEEVSYRELAARAGALSAELVRLGVGPETRVGWRWSARSSWWWRCSACSAPTAPTCRSTPATPRSAWPTCAPTRWAASPARCCSPSRRWPSASPRWRRRGRG
jgi:hypothetical protein